jgi:hypothetical protein
MNSFYLCVRYIFMDKIRSYLLYNFFISFLIQPINYKINPSCTNKKTESNNRGLLMLSRDVLSLVILTFY